MSMLKSVSHIDDREKGQGKGKGQDENGADGGDGASQRWKAEGEREEQLDGMQDISQQWNYDNERLLRGDQSHRHHQRSSSQSNLLPSSPSSSSSSSSTPMSLPRKIFITFLICLFLFLAGTVIVLSTAVHYFGIPESIDLTELEVPWDYGRGNIAEFQKELGMGSSEGLGNNGSATTGMDIGGDEEMSEIENTDDIVVHDMETGTRSRKVKWGKDGKGSGGYWMKSNWNGTVKDTKDWQRLYNVSDLPNERIPRLIHQTCKSDTLPPKWREVWKECREGMGDYEYMLWTDETSREFMQANYPSYLPMYDSYEYNIQRADAIRYFILHHFGGIYMDLDIGCKRRLDPLLQGNWDVILPRTKPVGISNDLIFAAKKSSFMNVVINGLKGFNHRYVTNYPTVMFSTGPMFLSAQYGIYTRAHPSSAPPTEAEIRVLPKILYGKNAQPGEAPHSFFSHFYGSSWHADDAGFITFLGSTGKKLMWVGLAILCLGAARLVYIKVKMMGGKGRGRSGHLRMTNWLFSGTERTERENEYHMVPFLDTEGGSGGGGGDHLFDRLNVNDDQGGNRTPTSPILATMWRVGNRILAAPVTFLPFQNPSSIHRERRSSGAVGGTETERPRSGILYYLPASLFPSSPSPRPRANRSASLAERLPASYRRSTPTPGNGSTLGLNIPEGQSFKGNNSSRLDSGGACPALSINLSSSPLPPPPYDLHSSPGSRSTSSLPPLSPNGK